MKQIRATRKRTTAIIQAMEVDDSLNMLQASQKIGVPVDVVAEWYQHGGERCAPPVKREFYLAAKKLLVEREKKEMERELIITAMSQAQAGDKKFERLLKKKGIEFCYNIPS